MRNPAVALALSILYVLASAPGSIGKVPAHKIALPNGIVIAAELPESNRKGLMGRKSLCGDCGMIFKFQKEWYHPFWMKDTLIPLAMIWIDGEGKIVHIVKRAKPCVNPKNPRVDCEVYRPRKPGKYVLEVNPAAAVGLDTGMVVKSTPPLD